MTKEVALKIKAGEDVDFVYEGVRMRGYVTCINCMSDGGLYFDIKCDDCSGEFSRVPYYNVLPANHPEKAPKYEVGDKELLKRMVNDYNYGLFPGYDREAIKKHFEEAVRKQQIRETIRKDLFNGLYSESEEKNMDIRIGDHVAFRFLGEILEGYVKKISFGISGSVYVDIDCGNGSIMTRYPADNITSNSSAERRSIGRDMKDAFRCLPYTGRLSNLKYYDETIKCDKEAKEVYTPNIKINQTEITGGDRKGLYSTVFFNHYSSNPVMVKKAEDANNDVLLAIAYANAIRYFGTNSQFKKAVDTKTIKLGNDYVIQHDFDWRNIFVPGENLKRKRWDIYTYVAVQLLFRTFSIKDIQEAIENCTYTKKEK